MLLWVSHRQEFAFSGQPCLDGPFKPGGSAADSDFLEQQTMPRLPARSLARGAGVLVWGKAKGKRAIQERAGVKTSERILNRGYEHVSCDARESYFLAAPMEQI